MVDAILLKLLTVTVSLLLITVPRKEYQQRLEQIPSLDQRGNAVDLKGWTYENRVSIQTGRHHYYYHRPGPTPNAPVMVMLHGFNTNGRAFQNFSPLDDRFELISINFPESSSTYQGHVEDFCGVLADFFRTLNLDTVTIVANSLGGPIVLEYLSTSPPIHVNHVILISSFAGGATRGERSRARLLADKLDRYPDFKLLYLVTTFTSIMHRLGTMGVGEDFPQHIIVIKRMEWYRQVMRCLANHNGIDNARRVTQPTLILHGLADKIVSPEMGAQLADLIPGSHLEILEGKGHAMVYTDAPVLVERIRKWLDSVTPSI